MAQASTLAARGLPGPFSWISSVSMYRPKRESSEKSKGSSATSKIYATIDLDKARVGRTRTVADAGNPRWNESFRIYCAHDAATVAFTVKSSNPVGATVLGRAQLPVPELLGGSEIDRWLQLSDDGGRLPAAGGTRIHVKLRFLDVSTELDWGKGLPAPAAYNYQGVPYTYFTQRQGCKVTLYQDAHVLSTFVPKIPLANGRYYRPARCWEDMLDAMNDARHLIYIAGWSVYARTVLVRDAGRPRVELGELLKAKAREGVRVLMLVWDDRTSVGQVRKDGLMATHDEDTAGFFAGTGVHCVLCPRDPDAGGSIVQGLKVSAMFTHHQKLVVVDAAMPSQRRSTSRRIVTFVGGIDLCDGRYDTQTHSLFRTLAGAHAGDFHQPNFPGASVEKGGPREPWHDVHCRLEGPVAWDVLHNFEQRWRKQGGGEELLLQLRRDFAGAVIPPSPVMFPEDGEAWNVQLFRSADGGAVAGFPERPEEAAKAGLVSGKDRVVDRSVQDAYIHAIRRARRFVYVENQYLVGSSFAWRSGDGVRVEDVEAGHLVPRELALKVAAKIEAGEEFRVYVVVPMWPEGVPESASVQAILDWQRRTMEMMYAEVARALRGRRVGAAADLREYLSFFCLGNREVGRSGGGGGEVAVEPTAALDVDSDYARAQYNRRFMIYVHSKMMIVDDEYIIVGSANINQRSMDGSRDTEIAMGAYQSYHVTAARGAARGQVHGFRMSLWYEHLGTLDNSFLQPESLECIRKVNRIANRNWELYARDSLQKDLPGHLLSYPVRVGYNGTVTELPGSPFFPDTNARMLGAKSDLLPPILTT